VAAEQRTFLGDVDRQVLGARIRDARVARGLSQTELAGSEFSVAHISRIEAGLRRPSRQVLERLAERLALSADDLLASLSQRRLDEARLGLDYAELSLESGEPAEAETQAARVLGSLPRTAPAALLDRAAFLRARALESLGRLDDAIELLDGLAERGPSLDWAGWCVALCRCYRESGDFGRSVDLGERVVAAMRTAGLDGSDEAVQMTVTLAAAYFERGDVGHAVRLCRRAIDAADASGSAKARASAYWNASMIEAKEGSVAKAIPLARKALALLSEGEGGRNLARLRSQLGIMLLQADPPEVAEAAGNLDRARDEFAATSSSPVDIARNDLARARAMFLADDRHEAAELAARIAADSATAAPLIAADAQCLQGQIRAADGDVDAAIADYREGARILTGLGADRTAAQLWFELGTLMDELGATDAARDAYRRAAASTGLHTHVAGNVSADKR
jgi:tetratricopeptide (TPR) repeat protein